MAAPVRSSGSKVVGIAVVATATMVGIGSIYLPFFADRDKMRGMHEEKDAPTSVMLAQEIKKLQKEGLLRSDDHSGQQAIKDEMQKQKNAPGSMWKQFPK